MLAWLALLAPSALTGALCALFIKKPWAIYIAGALPWFGLLFALIYTVYLAPDADGGDGFWIIAQVFGGTIAAFTGIMTFRAIKNLLKNNSSSSAD